MIPIFFQTTDTFISYFSMLHRICICSILSHICSLFFFCLAQDVDHNDEQEEDNDIPPNIPPLPQSHLQALQNRTPDSKGNVAKIVSQFQEAVNSSNVNINIIV